MRGTNGWLATTMLILGLLLAPRAHAAGRNDLTVDAVLQELRLAQSQLQAIERETSRKRVDANAVRTGLRDVSARLDRLEKQLRRMRRVEPPAPVPMDDASFAALRRSVDRVPFTADKLGILSTAAATQFFVVPQVLTLLDEVAGSTARLDALRILWPRVLDRQNSFLIYDSFRFSDDRSRARAILER